MDDEVGLRVVEGVEQLGPRSNVAADHRDALYVIDQRGRPHDVEARHLIAALDQGPGEVGPDKAGAAGDDDSHAILP